VPVLHEPDVVVNVHGENPVGGVIPIKSNIAGPPAIVRFAVLKAAMGSETPMSLIVPVVPNIGSVPDRSIPVTAGGVAQVGDAEKAMQGAIVVTATKPPVMLAALRMPPPPMGIGVADRVADPIARAVRVPAQNVYLFSNFFVMSIS